MEALLNGFAEGIALDDRGYVSEGSGENIFLVTGDIVLTPPLSSSILPGITRDSIIQICQELGISVKERTIQRAALYVADELFFTGTAAEVTPIRSVDRITVGKGGRGPITEKIQEMFFKITKGTEPAPGDWLTYVHKSVRESKPAPADNNGFEATPVTKDDSDTSPILSFQTAARD
jgi:branched-chain amino acid aminotransferase